MVAQETRNVTGNLHPEDTERNQEDIIKEENQQVKPAVNNAIVNNHVAEKNENNSTSIVGRIQRVKEQQNNSNWRGAKGAIDKKSGSWSGREISQKRSDDSLQLALVPRERPAPPDRSLTISFAPARTCALNTRRRLDSLPSTPSPPSVTSPNASALLSPRARIPTFSHLPPRRPPPPTPQLLHNSFNQPMAPNASVQLPPPPPPSSPRISSLYFTLIPPPLPPRSHSNSCLQADQTNTPD